MVEVGWFILLLGVLLIVAEAFVPGFVIIWFGIAAFIAAIPAYLGAPAWVVAFVYFFAVAILVTIGRRIVTQRISREAMKLRTNVDSLPGLKGVVIEEVDPVCGKGLVRVGREVWSAVTEDGQKIAKDEVVTVVRVSGVKLVVKKEEV